jgi:predicted DsbA family dithiol-disulfide isomerase
MTSLAANTPTADSLTVDIWSDIACPWCYIGKRRFERALARFPQRERVTVRWRSFQLDPGAPRRRAVSVTQMLAEKYGVPLSQAEAMNARVTAEAAAEGLTYHLEKLKLVNTLDAHRLLQFAIAQRRGVAMTERLFLAYFTEGVDLADTEALAGLAEDAGLEPQAARGVLATDVYRDAVMKDQAEAQHLGVTGVPFFVLAGRYGVSGAQPPEVLAGALARAWESVSPLTLVGGADAGACADGSCATLGPTHS